MLGYQKRNHRCGNPKHHPGKHKDRLQSQHRGDSPSYRRCDNQSAEVRHLQPAKRAHHVFARRVFGNGSRKERPIHPANAKEQPTDEQLPGVRSQRQSYYGNPSGPKADEGEGF